MKFVSVVMSVYNGEKFLRESLDSILGQTHALFEFIIVNDYSLDMTGPILRSYAQQDNRVKIIENEANLGLTRSLNKAIKESKGEYIARQDADDVSHPERFARQVYFLETHPQVALLGTSGLLISDAGRVLRIEKVNTNQAKLRKSLIQRNQFIHGSVMLRKSCLESIGLYCEELIYGQDYDLFLRIAEKYSVANIEEPFYSYRINIDSISTKRIAEQLLNGLIIRKAAQLRRKQKLIVWSQEQYEEIKKSVNTFWGRKILSFNIHMSKGRNYCLLGMKKEARLEFRKASVVLPSFKGLFHFLKTFL